MSQGGTPFLKMHGLGNDFVVLDLRAHPLALSPERVRALADRRTGIGCDQLITIEPPRDRGVAFMGIRNADGSVVESCGNATRCVGAVLLAETGLATLNLESLGGPLVVERAENGLVCVDMGPARLAWDAIPLAHPQDTLALDLSVGPLSAPSAVSMGNPHAVFVVDDVDAIDLPTWGPTVEHHALFPRRTNVEIIQARADGSVRMRVWERGVGMTRACGTGACAALVTAVRRGLVPERKAPVDLDGGRLWIEWRESDGHVRMTGPATRVFSGVLDPETGS
ncbi:diaminopimelate epimerase [Pararhodospirillum oryzae]|uniref:Diaminopimelate epimerase n=1 Tax=Pararhodospirillum oryzae TaxID=478448 RepID=A0A512HBC4_9PROT|nr:diaminopimelate epimerase [Pararhodospirillum oryzae]GEO82753.1 diaminopimelate epimerase [Pararhodospirillum oryzae]